MKDFGSWISRAWTITSGNLWPFVGATFMVFLISMTGILTPVMMCGLTGMAIKAIRGEPVGVSDVYMGFSKFKNTIPYLLIMLVFVVFIFFIISIIAVIIATLGKGNEKEIMPIFMFFIMIFYAVIIVISLAVGPILGIVFIFSYFRVMEYDEDGWIALKASWEMVRKDFWMSWLASFVLNLISNIGAYACYVGFLFSYPLSIIAYGIGFLEQDNKKEWIA